MAFTILGGGWSNNWSLTKLGRIKIEVTQRKYQLLNTVEVVLMFVVDQAAIFSATCNQMNAPCEQLSSNKVPNCAWSIRQDVDQDLRCLRKTFTCSCHIALLSRGQFLESAHSRIYVFFFFFFFGGGGLTHRGLTKKICQGTLDMSL